MREDELEEILQQTALLLLKHPLAAQSLIYAFIAEGRRFGATPEGRRWRELLAGSEFARRGRALWDATHLNMLEDDPKTLLPTTIVDAIVQILGRPDLQDFLMGVQMKGLSGETDRP